MPDKRKVPAGDKKESAMAEEHETYKGKEIVIKMEDDRPELYIDGRHIRTLRVRSGGYSVAIYPVSVEPSLTDLAKKIIDSRDTLERKKEERRK